MGFMGWQMKTGWINIKFNSNFKICKHNIKSENGSCRKSQNAFIKVNTELHIWVEVFKIV